MIQASTVVAATAINTFGMRGLMRRSTIMMPKHRRQ